MILRLLVPLLVLLAAGLWYAGRPLDHPPGVTAPEEPRQTDVASQAPIRHRGYHLTPVARFEAEARVLGKKRYRDDATARLAPYDLAIGWGPMSDTAVLDAIELLQTQRVYTWRRGPGAPGPREIILHSTNIHIVPATADVAAALARLKEGHLVRLQGRLVDVVANDGTRWRTSRSRTDAGVGACEILWAEGIEIVDG